MKNTLSIYPNDLITSLCIGKFDGVHVAHQKLLSRSDISGGVLIIDSGFPPFLTPFQENLIDLPIFRVRLEEIKEMGVKDFAIFLRIRFPNLSRIIVGYDFRFGKDRSYCADDLKDFFIVHVENEVKINGYSIHKQEIVRSLHEGRVKIANMMLGREYAIRGEIIQGQGIGNKECVPTINLRVEKYILPKDGVYVTWSEINGVRYRSVSFVGVRLSTDGEFAIETHLLEGDFSVWRNQNLEKSLEIKDNLLKNIQEVTIFFVDFLRENQKFDSLLLLKKQIQKDIAQALEKFDTKTN